MEYLSEIFNVVENITHYSRAVSVFCGIAIFFYVAFMEVHKSSTGSKKPNASSSSSRLVAPLVVVSDIDHTIKEGNRLWNTPPVEGMVELFNELHQKNGAGGGAEEEEGPGAIQFHYLTNRYGPLGSVSRKWNPANFLFAYRFPQPSNLYARPSGDLWGYVTRQPNHKKTVLDCLLPTEEVTGCGGGGGGGKTKKGSSPRPALLLLGDSTENDALVYCDFCCRKEHHDVPAVIGIRVVSSQEETSSSEKKKAKNKKKDAAALAKLVTLQQKLKASGNTAAEMIQFREVAELRDYLGKHPRWGEALLAAGAGGRK